MFRTCRDQRRRREGRLVENGTVLCPRSRENLDIEHCYECAAFVDLVDVGEPTYLYCRPPHSGSARPDGYAPWPFI